MLKFIHNDFELNLTHLKANFNWTNIWFKTDLISEFTFPFSLPESEWSKIINLSNYNSLLTTNIYKGKLYRDGELSNATLKIEQKKGKFVDVIIFVGLEDFPDFEKSLKDLNLINIDVDDIKEHALSVKSQGYPDVNYNFPSVHSDKYDPNGEEFREFRCINYFKDGAYVENSILPGTNMDSIQNIMQPLPYLMYVLNEVFSQAGFTLTGDILNIPDFKKALLFSDGAYFNSIKKENISLSYTKSQYDSVVNGLDIYTDVVYNKAITVTRKGIYDLFGNVYCLQNYNKDGLIVKKKNNVEITIRIQRGATVLTLYSFTDFSETAATDTVIPILINKDIDIPLDLEVGDIIQLYVTEGRRDLSNDPTPDYAEMSSLELIPIRYKFDDGSFIVSVQDEDKIDLKRTVPDMSCSDLINQIRLSKNLTFDIVENQVIMNFIKIDRSDSIDISEFDIEEPVEKFNDDRSFEMLYSDGKSNDKYSYSQVYVDKSAYVVDDYNKSKNTNEIRFDFLPYPIITRNAIKTAVSFDDSESKLRLVFYDNTVEQSYPACFWNELFDMKNLYFNYYKDWLSFRTNSIEYTWQFIVTSEKLKEIFSKSIQYCYNNYHVFSEVEKQRLDAMYSLVSAKSESLF